MGQKKICYERQQKKKNIRKFFFFSNEEYKKRLNNNFYEFFVQKSLLKQLWERFQEFLRTKQLTPSGDQPYFFEQSTK